jgi:hypothetical protein
MFLSHRHTFCITISTVTSKGVKSARNAPKSVEKQVDFLAEIGG